MAESSEVRSAMQRFGIIGHSEPLLEAVDRAIRVAPIDLSVLVSGESGTGKEFFPKIIHAYSPRKHAKYIAVNCGAIPEGTIDSELFGHEKGAFTGAVSDRKGYFEEADGGTIFLDEVAELPLTTQARLLRVLETGEFIRVGSSQVSKANVRIVAATNVDMAKAVAEGRFREDLYYRLSTVTIPVPPLRDRGSDVTLLARKFAADFSERYHTPRIEFSEEALESLLSYRWPGNVRQLKNVVEQLALFEAGKTISRKILEHYLPATGSSLITSGDFSENPTSTTDREMLLGMILNLRKEISRLSARIDELEGNSVMPLPPRPLLGHIDDAEEITPPIRSIVKFQPYTSSFPPLVTAEAEEPQTLEETEKETIRRSLERNGGRRKATAKELNISERTLYRKIKEYGIE
ncbi:MAG: sigma-54 dependent transcriptional regulator [Duncaniella sp.]|nr:sigma-54 dependent transcriptional regulator [Duncaniella sp.]